MLCPNAKVSGAGGAPLDYEVSAHIDRGPAPVELSRWDLSDPLAAGETHVPLALPPGTYDVRIESIPAV